MVRLAAEFDGVGPDAMEVSAGRLARACCCSDNQNMAETEVRDAIALAMDPQGVYRVGGSRVTLDTVILAFNRGASAEEIVQDFPALQLADVYQVIGYYLKHSAEFTEYFEKRERDEKELLDAHRNEWSPKGLRERLLARREGR